MSLLKSLLGKPDRDTFAEKLASLLRAGGAGAVHYDRERFRLVFDGELGAGELFLHNAWTEYSLPGADRDQVLLRYVSTVIQMHENQGEMWAQARAMLRPRVRNRGYIEQCEMEMQVQGARGEVFAWRPLAQHLCFFLVVDYPQSMRLVKHVDLEQWGVSFEDAYGTAIENLRRRTRGAFKEIAPGLFRSPWEDEYDPTRLLLPDVLRQVSVRGDLVAMVPGPNLLLLAGSDDADGLRRMAEVSLEALAQPRAMSGIPVRWAGDRWAPFLPGKESPLYVPFKRAMLASLEREYAGQKTLLDKLHEQRGEQLLVPLYGIIPAPVDGEMQSDIAGHASWFDGADSLLPWADYINLVRVDAAGKPVPLAFVEWERLVAVAGNLLEKTPHYPFRFRTRGFPSEAQLRELGVEQ